MSYILTGEWSAFDWVGVWMGVFLSATLTVYGFATTPKRKLPGHQGLVAAFRALRPRIE